MIAVNIIEGKVNIINDRKFPMQDDEVGDFSIQKLNFFIILDVQNAYEYVKFEIVSVSTIGDLKKIFLDISLVENIIETVLGVNSCNDCLEKIMYKFI